MPGKLSSLIGSIRRKPTRAADGRSEVAAGGSNNKKTAVGEDLMHLGLKNAKFVATAITTLASGAPLDDKELLLEHGVAMLQSLPLNSGLSETVSDGFISMLWDDMPHPPQTMTGPTMRYRKHDGSGNNPWGMYNFGTGTYKINRLIMKQYRKWAKQDHHTRELCLLYGLKDQTYQMLSLYLKLFSNVKMGSSASILLV
jgi:hypothetical protein